MECIRHKKVEMLEMKNIISKREYMRLSTEENINKLNDTAVDDIQTEAHRGEKNEKKNQISSMCTEKKEPEERQNND